jgi:drug/metabolite transporter (DMT)-like permease
VSDDLGPRQAAFLFAVVVLAWGLNWPVTKVIVESVPPLWTTAIRSWIAVAALLPILWIGNTLIVPDRGDLPVILSIALLHMVAFSTLIAAGLQYVPASQGILLGYTTPIWVAIGARAVLGERITRQRLAGIVLGLGGLAVIFNPLALDWSDDRTLLGCGLVMLAAVCWAASIVYVRSHKWIATPFELLIWQVLVAAVVLSVAAALVEGVPSIAWHPRLLLLLLYGGVFGTALAYWAMSMINRSLPALTTSLGILATPLVGIASAALLLGERIEPSLMLATGLIVGGIAIGTLSDPGKGEPRRSHKG